MLALILIFVPVGLVTLAMVRAFPSATPISSRISLLIVLAMLLNVAWAVVRGYWLSATIMCLGTASAMCGYCVAVRGERLHREFLERQDDLG